MTMPKSIFRRRLLISALAAIGMSATMFGASIQAAEIEEIHFLIPGGAGGGWDGTARGTGEALTKAGLLKGASFENMSGGGGGKAIGYLIKNAKRNEGTLMVNSTPIVVRSITKVFPYSFRDLTPIAATIGDYGALVVTADSPLKTFDDVLTAFRADRRSIKVAGGSVKGDLDHLVVAQAFQAAGEDPSKVVYIPYDAGGKALAGLLSGETQILSTGFGEALEQARNGQVRILAVTSEKSVEGYASLKEQGYDVVFANWRGFFAAPGISDDLAKSYTALLGKMYDTPEWEAVRARNGWANLYKPGAEFVSFLEDQEKAISDLRKKLGFSD